MVSVIVPAHNEEVSLKGCLDALLADARPGELQVIVVCNGCTDSTAAVARSFGPAVTVIETEVASKRHALNLGDRAAAGFPRCYVDGDVQVTTEHLRALVDAVGRGALVAVPRLDVELSGRPWVVRSFFRVWMQLPFFRDGMASSGIYVLSEEGRARFGEFPDLIADDHYVLSHFEGEERRLVEGSRSLVQAPWSAADIVRIKTRAFLAQRQLEMEPSLNVRQHGARSSWLGVVAADRRLWTSMPVYAALNVVAEIRARRRFRAQDFSWERDVSSRRAPAA